MSVYIVQMQNSSAVNNSVDLVGSMFACCLLVFGVLVYRLLTTSALASAWDTSGAESSKDRTIVSLKMIGLGMAFPVFLGLITLLGEMPVLLKAFPLWATYTGLLFCLLFGIIAMLFWADREEVENYSIDCTHQDLIEAKLRKRSLETKIVGYGFGVWIIGMAISLTWLLHLVGRSMHDILKDF